MQGKIKYYDSDRGFGFIERPGDNNLFFHIADFSAASDLPRIGDLCTFDLGNNRKGECAVNVTIL